jgi:hypothetical protein
MGDKRRSRRTNINLNIFLAIRNIYNQLTIYERLKTGICGLLAKQQIATCYYPQMMEKMVIKN